MPLDTESEVLVAQMDAENLKNATYNAIELLLESTARQQPLVIVCEDLHWADPTSLALLNHVLSLTQPRTAAFCLCLPSET